MLFTRSRSRSRSLSLSLSLSRRSPRSSAGEILGHGDSETPTEGGIDRRRCQHIAPKCPLVVLLSKAPKRATQICTGPVVGPNHTFLPKLRSSFATACLAILLLVASANIKNGTVEPGRTCHNPSHESFHVVVWFAAPNPGPPAAGLEAQPGLVFRWSFGRSVISSSIRTVRTTPVSTEILLGQHWGASVANRRTQWGW